MEELYEGLSVTLSEADKALINERVETQKAEAKKVAQNDEEFVNKIKAQQAKGIYSGAEKWLKKITGVDFSAVDKELKFGDRYKAMLEMAVAEVKSSGDSTNQELQDKLLEAKESLRKLQDEVIPEMEDGFKARFAQKQIKDKLRDKLDGLRIIKDKKKQALKYTQALLGDDYQLGWDEETEDVTIKTKAGLDPVINDKTASLEEVLEYIADDGGFIQKRQEGGGSSSSGEGGEAPDIPVGELSDNAKKMAESFN